MHNLLKKLIIRHGNIQITAVITLFIVGFSMCISLFDSWFFNHPVMPSFYLSVLIPLLLAPPVTYTLVYLIRQLDSAEQNLLEREERLSNFAADVAHELRTPLSILRLNLDSLTDTDTVQALRQDVNSMSRLVDQLLTLAHLDTLGINNEDKADLHAVCIDVAAHLAPLAIKEKRKIEVGGYDKPVVINGDHITLERAFRNLVENAITYSDRESIITLEVGQDAKVRVIDQGPGVPVEEREAIFERFLRSDRRGSGSGLGLHIVQRIINAHGGTIGVSETPGGGATFTISFTDTA